MTAPAEILRPRRKKRKWLGWLIGLVSLVIVIVVAWNIGDRLARDYAEAYVHDKLVSILHLEPDHPMDIVIGDGSLIAQALAGSINSVKVHIDDVSVGDFTGSVNLAATGIPLDQAKPLKTIAVEIIVDEEDAEKLRSSLSGLPVESVSFADKLITVGISLSFFGVPIPVSVLLAPSASDGQLLFDPDTITIGNAKVSVADLKKGVFGGAAEALLPPRPYCVAQYLPKDLVLKDAEVREKTLVLTFRAKNVSLGGAGLSELGTCPA
jgi:LmeA-like phospholipid-binding